MFALLEVFGSYPKKIRIRGGKYYKFGWIGIRNTFSPFFKIKDCYQLMVDVQYLVGEPVIKSIKQLSLSASFN